MHWLIVVSLVWAFSFGLIKGRLAGVDPSLVAFVRVSLSLLVFLPLLRVRDLRGRDAGLLLGLGAIQFGLMYVAYTAAFRHLQAFEVALWTIFTPLFVCLFEDLWARRFHFWPVMAAVLATAGAAIVSPPAGDAWLGIGLVQISNACFAAGQVVYRRWRLTRPATVDARVFALPYLGAVAVTLPAAWPALATLPALDASQWLTVGYLGIVASGVCFFLWNHGATRTGPGPLAVLNNAKIPLGVACSLLVFGERTDVTRLLLGGAIVVAAGLLAEWSDRRATAAAP